MFPSAARARCSDPRLLAAVTVGYVQRLRDELGSRAWVTSYTNQAQGYIPTQLLIDEGGYEGGDINIIAGHPARYADVRAATAARLCQRCL